MRDALSLLLGIQDYRVAVFGVPRLPESLQKQWRGCLVLDIRMPGMDGLTLQKHLAQLGGELPVIIATGHGDVASAREAFRAFAVDFLEKPLDHRKLLAAIADAFSRQRTRLVAEMNRSEVERLLAG